MNLDQASLKITKLVINAAKENSSIEHLRERASKLVQVKELKFSLFNKIFNDLVTINVITETSGYLELVSENDHFFNLIKNNDPLSWEYIGSLQKISDEFQIKQFKFDDSNKKQLGLDGEIAVVNYLKENTPTNDHELIKHVSIYDDSAGYDISFTNRADPNIKIMIEVKSTIRNDDFFEFYITKNEFNIAQKNPNSWYLALVKFQQNNRAIKFIKISFIEDWLPKEIDARASWSVSKVIIKNYDSLPEKLRLE
jgi:hypothetical protein